MTASWVAALCHDPLPALLAAEDESLTYFVQRDLLAAPVPPVTVLWQLPEPTKLVRKQLDDGAWRYPGKTRHPLTGTDYFLLETYRNVRVLVEMYGFNSANPALARAAAYLFSQQTEDGDIRGILGNQYMPYYHGALLELLIKAGYDGDARVLRGLEWLLAVRQADGGWIVPTQAVPSRERTGSFWSGPPLPPDRALPHAHLATGMVLRAFAAHPTYRHRPEAHAAGEALKRRFFQSDKYNDRKATAYWFKYQFPFWWANLLTALDALSRLGFDRGDAQIAAGLDWFVHNQEADGLWPTGYGSGRRAARNRRWVGLAIGRVLRRFYGED
jgi:hypothetical protein